MKPVVAIVAPGNMGAAVAKRLHEQGIQVLTSLDGRSPDSLARAAAAGMHGVSAERLVDADFLLSILPPSAALSFAEQLAPALLRATHKPVYVDCNAVSPETVSHVGAAISATATAFVDAGIIGTPPEPGKPGPRFYASGEHAPLFAALGDYGLDIRVLKGPIGAASALKLSFAGINKGLTAVATAMILASSRNGADVALHAEIAQNWPELYASLRRQVPGMLPKAYRWVAEMREIAAFAGDDTAAGEMFVAASGLFGRVARDVAGKGRESAVLTQFFAVENKL